MFLLYIPPFAHLVADGGYGALTAYLWELFHDGGYPDWALYHPESPTVFHLFSHQFAHAGLYHLVSNLAVLISAGKHVERACREYILLVFLLGGAAGALAHGMWDTLPLLGSSGAVAAVLGCYLAFRPGLGNSVRMIVFWLFLFNVVPLFLAVDNISYAAHIGGFIAGVVLGSIYYGVARRRAGRGGGTPDTTSS